MPQWSDYQEEVAAFFRVLGLSAATNVSVQGVRTRHDVDVVVRSQHAGFDIQWLIECKAWKAPVPKEKVLALRMIVEDTGADRGFLMAESGYQSGALEAAHNANVMLTSLADLRETLAHEIGMAKLRSLLPRIEDCRERYWRIGKSDRIEFDLRPDVFSGGFSGDHVIKAVEHTLYQAIFSGFPIKYDRTEAVLHVLGGRRGMVRVDPGCEGALSTPAELFRVLDEELGELERRLNAAEGALGLRTNEPSAPTSEATEHSPESRPAPGDRGI